MNTNELRALLDASVTKEQEEALSASLHQAVSSAQAAGDPFALLDAWSDLDAFLGVGPPEEFARPQQAAAALPPTPARSVVADEATPPQPPKFRPDFTQIFGVPLPTIPREPTPPPSAVAAPVVPVVPVDFITPDLPNHLFGVPLPVLPQPPTPQQQQQPAAAISVVPVVSGAITPPQLRQPAFLTPPQSLPRPLPHPQLRQPQYQPQPQLHLQPTTPPAPPRPIARPRARRQPPTPKTPRMTPAQIREAAYAQFYGRRAGGGGAGGVAAPVQFQQQLPPPPPPAAPGKLTMEEILRMQVGWMMRGRGEEEGGAMGGEAKRARWM